MEKDRNFSAALIQLVSIRFLGLFNSTAFVTLALLSMVSTQQKYFEHTSIVASVCLTFIIPHILFPGVAGFVADRYSKRNILVLSKLAEMFIMVGGIITLNTLNYNNYRGIWWFLFLLGTKNCFFRSCFYGYLPEVFERERLGLVNGLVNTATYMAAAFGIICGYYMRQLIGSYSGVTMGSCSWLFGAIAFLSCVVSFHLPTTPPADRTQKLPGWKLIFGFFDAFNYPAKARGFGFSIVGELFYFTYLSSISFMLLVLIREIITHSYQFNILHGVLIFSSPFSGIALGSIVCSFLCRRRIALSIVPVGAAGAVLFPLLFGIFASRPDSITFASLVPLLVMFMLSGFFVSLFVLPLRQFEQENSPEKHRGRFYANCNAIYFLSVIITFIIVVIFSYSLKMDLSSISILIALYALCLSLYIMFIHPNIFLRFAIMVLSHTFYRLEQHGVDKLPQSGPALLVANHVSFTDMLFITACTPRKIYFMMHEDFYNLPVLNLFAHWVQFIKVPAPQKPKQMQQLFTQVKQLLAEGNMVCVFPEGGITQNGIMQGFHSGIKPFVPEDVEVPVFPVRLGMVWGPFLTIHEDKLKIMPPHELPMPVSVTVGNPVSADLSTYQMRQVLSELAAETEMPPRYNEKTLHHQFAHRTRRHPFQKSFSDFEGKSLNNFSFLVRALLLSRKIRNIVPEDCEYVGVMMPSCMAHAVTLLAVMFADKTPAMINFTASESTIQKSLEKADVTCILTSKAFLTKAKIKPSPKMVFLEDIAKKITGSEKFWVTLATACLPSREIMNIFAPESHDDVYRNAILLFSSGTTADPKGVMLTHHNFNSDFFSFWRVIGWTKSDCIVGNLPLFHSFGLMVCFWLPMISGARIVYIPNPLDHTSVVRLIETCKATLMVATPTFLQAYLRKASAEQFKSLRLVVTGGEKLRPDIAEKYKSITGLTVVEGYGCTETSPIVSINLSSSIFTLGSEAGVPGSIGVPMPGVCVKIVDPETFEPLPEDHEGLLLVKGPIVMKGYLKDSEGTANVLKDGWYNTGDIAKMRWDGYITITGRQSRFSKISGEMVPHEMVEAAISEIIKKDTRCVAVAGKPDGRKGEKLVVLYSDKDIDPKEIIQGLKEKGLTNLWIPKNDDFIYIEHMPLLGTGKLDLRRVKELVAAL